MTWRDGVHLTGTPIWCDARRRRDLSFLSSADRSGRSGHGQLITTRLTMALLGIRDRDHRGTLAVPLRQRFTLGTIRLELIPSGRGFGAAALYADIAGRTVLYAGAVRTTTGGVDDAGELRNCEAVVVAAPYGAPGDTFPPLAGEIAAATQWARDQLAVDRRPVLFVDSVMDGLEVACMLGASGIAVAGSRALRDAGQRISGLIPPPQLINGQIAIGRSLPPRPLDRAPEPPPDPFAEAPSEKSGVPVIGSPGSPGAPSREPRAIVWLDSDRASLVRILGDRPATTALASARAHAGAAGYDKAFVWASAADRAQLLGWIEATGARDIFVTGACAEPIVAALGPRARLIGPPHQMSLFPSEASP